MAEPFSCGQCGQNFRSREELDQHNAKLHMSGGSGDMGRGAMSGDDTGKTQGDVGKERR